MDAAMRPMRSRLFSASLLLAAVASGLVAGETHLRRGPGVNDASLTANPEPEVIGDGRGGQGSHTPRLNHDGRFVVFESTVRLSRDDNDNRRDVYVYDRTARIYRKMHRPEGSYATGGGTISPDGEYVAYHSYDVAARQGIEPITSILLVELETGNTRRIPPPWKGPNSKGEALFPELGNHGLPMAFTSSAPGLASRTLLNIRQVYLYDRSSEDIRLISHGTDGSPANRACAEARVSRDGRRVAFLSSATNLAVELPKDSLAFHLYYVDRSTGTFIRVDDIERGVDPKGWIVDGLDMDEEGNTVVFQARARHTGKSRETLENSDLFVFDASTGTAARVTSGIFAGRSSSARISGNGRWIAFILTPNPGKRETGGVVVYDRLRNLWRMAVSGRCLSPAISGDGHWIAFESADSSITHDRKGTSRIFVLENPSYEVVDASH